MTVSHATLTGAELHEPKGIATASTKTVYVADGAGSGSWTTLDYNTLPNGVPIGFAYTQSTTPATYTSTIPRDNTIPQNTEGTEILQVSITPKSSTSILRVEIQVCVTEDGNTSTFIQGALFLDSEASARCTAILTGQGGAPADANGSLVYHMVAGSTSAKTFKLRAGGDLGGSWHFNKNFYGENYGNTLISSISVTEIKA